MTQDNNMPAFPHNLGNLQFETAGMSLRDYFAAQALVGMTMNAETAAKLAYEYADAMLEARK